MNPPVSINNDACGTILVVDDRQSNREVLLDILEADGHQVIDVSRGEDALKAIEEHDIDVVLLDIMMPEMDGFDVCRAIKNMPGKESIHVILVTARDDRKDMIKGTAWGADDYFTKPIDAKHLRLRVRNAVKMKALHDQVEAQYAKLRELESSRDALVHMLVHDMRGHLTSIVSGVELLRRCSPEELVDESKELLGCVHAGAGKLVSMVNDVLDVNRAEEAGLPVSTEEVAMLELAREVVESHQMPGRVEVTLVEEFPTEEKICCDPSLTRRVLENLLGNALKFAPTSSRVTVALAFRSSPEGRLVGTPLSRLLERTTLHPYLQKRLS